MLEMSQILVFFHIVLFAYWIGTDLGVLITSVYASKPGISAESKSNLLKANILIDMFPRTCLVLMIPVGLTLASNWGLPISNAMLMLVWIVSFAWTWLVWQVHFKHGTAIGKTYWNVDLVVRILATVAFVGFGLWCLLTGGPVESKWLAVKILLFGLTVSCGVIVRFMLLSWSKPANIAKFDPSKPTPFFNPIRNVVFIIWALVFAMAFLGSTKPF